MLLSATAPAARFAEGQASVTGRPSAPTGDGLGNRTRLLRFLSKQRGTTDYILATTTILEASSIVIRTGEPVMVLGGYTGTTPIVSQTELARSIAVGKVRYVRSVVLA